MNNYFKLSDKVFDITEKYPEVIELLAANGFENLRNNMMRKTLGKTISLEMALKSKKINTEIFEQKVIDLIESNRPSLTFGLTEAKSDEGDVRIEGILPCPIRVPLLERLENWFGNQGHKYSYDLKSASMGVDWILDKIVDNNDESVLADAFISAGFSLFFDKRLMGKHKENGVFADLTGAENFNSTFQNEEIDLRDPKKQYSVIGIVAAVFMVNNRVLRNRKFPESWEDLLSPEFENSIALPMQDLDLFNAVLLNLYKNFGEEGIKKLGRSLMASMHPAQMLKSNSRKADANPPAVTVMPYFFTHMIGEKSDFTPVWPKEGAIISPIFLLTKVDKADKIRPFAEFMFSKEMGELLSVNGKFPSTHPEVDNKLSSDQNFMWLGWDFINNNDIGELLNVTEAMFYTSTMEDI